MQFDSDTLKKVMLMNDKELKELITSIALEKGFSLKEISQNEITKVRNALNIISKNPTIANEIFNHFGKGGKIK